MSTKEFEIETLDEMQNYVTNILCYDVKNVICIIMAEITKYGTQ